MSLEFFTALVVMYGLTGSPEDFAFTAWYFSEDDCIAAMDSTDFFSTLKDTHITCHPSNVISQSPRPKARPTH